MYSFQYRTPHLEILLALPFSSISQGLLSASPLPSPIDIGTCLWTPVFNSTIPCFTKYHYQIHPSTTPCIALHSLSYLGHIVLPLNPTQFAHLNCDAPDGPDLFVRRTIALSALEVPGYLLGGVSSDEGGDKGVRCFEGGEDIHGAVGEAVADGLAEPGCT